MICPGFECALAENTKRLTLTASKITRINADGGHDFAISRRDSGETQPLVGPHEGSRIVTRQTSKVKHTSTDCDSRLRQDSGTIKLKEKHELRKYVGKCSCDAFGTYCKLCNCSETTANLLAENALQSATVYLQLLYHRTIQYLHMHTRAFNVPFFNSFCTPPKTAKYSCCAACRPRHTHVARLLQPRHTTGRNYPASQH